jgi:hypothetical protein
MSQAPLIHRAFLLSVAVAIVGCGSSTPTNANPLGGGYTGSGLYDATTPSGDDSGGNDSSASYSSSGSGFSGGSTSGGGGTSSSGGGGGVTSSEGGTSSGGGGGTCVPSCSSDSDCQNSCPPVAGGVNCCDSMSGMCFPSQTAACPTMGVGASE